MVRMVYSLESALLHLLSKLNAGEAILAWLMDTVSYTEQPYAGLWLGNCQGFG